MLTAFKNVASETISLTAVNPSSNSSKDGEKVTQIFLIFFTRATISLKNGNSLLEMFEERATFKAFATDGNWLNLTGYHFSPNAVPFVTIGENVITFLAFFDK